MNSLEKLLAAIFGILVFVLMVAVFGGLTACIMEALARHGVTINDV